jgi:hypothetical protein
VTSEVLVREQMQEILNRLNIPLKLKWAPNSHKPIHGEINQNILFIYDENEKDAWETFTHEMLEFKLKKVNDVYRETVNALIEVIQKITYVEKESFIESIPIMIDAIQKVKLR